MGPLMSTTMSDQDTSPWIAEVRSDTGGLVTRWVPARASLHDRATLVMEAHRRLRNNEVLPGTYTVVPPPAADHQDVITLHHGVAEPTEVPLPPEPARDGSMVIEARGPDGGMHRAWRVASNGKWAGRGGHAAAALQDWADVVEFAIRRGLRLVVCPVGPTPGGGR